MREAVRSIALQTRSLPLPIVNVFHICLVGINHTHIYTYVDDEEEGATVHTIP
jgi:hypothetical protein